MIAEKQNHEDLLNISNKLIKIIETNNLKEVKKQANTDKDLAEMADYLKVAIFKYM